MAQDVRCPQTPVALTVGTHKHRLLAGEIPPRCMCGTVSVPHPVEDRYVCPVSFPPALYRGLKGPVCERCGFVPEDPCQLDVNHKDGDRLNNDPSNLQTLCANCHRLISSQDGWKARKYAHRRHLFAERDKVEKPRAEQPLESVK